MTPMQVYNTLQVAEERERLMQIKHLIIGGGAIDEALEAELRHFPNAVWSTYGMTETLSHIALRRINSPSPTTLFRSEGVKEWRSSSQIRSSGVQECRSSDDTWASNPSSPNPHPSSNFRSEGVKEWRSGGVHPKSGVQEFRSVGVQTIPWQAIPHLKTLIPHPTLGVKE